MTYERFKELWIQAGLNNMPKFENPICMDGMSPHTIDALIAASNGDFSHFEKIDMILSDKKMSLNEIEQYCRERFNNMTK